MIGGSSEPELRISFEDDSSAFPLCEIQPHSSLCLYSIAIPRFKCPECYPADSSSCGSIIVSSAPITTKHLFSRVSEQCMRLRLKTTYEVIVYSFEYIKNILKNNPSSKSCIFLVHNISSPQANSLTLSSFEIPSHPIPSMFLSLPDIHFQQQPSALSPFSSVDQNIKVWGLFADLTGA